MARPNSLVKLFKYSCYTSSKVNFNVGSFQTELSIFNYSDFISKTPWRHQNVSKFSTTSRKRSQEQRKPDWNRAVSDAEKIVGYPTSYLTLRSLFSDEMSNIAVHIRKLVGTSHPLLKIAKRLIYNGRHNMQTRGLIILLLSKAAGHMGPQLLESDLTDGVSDKQRSLAEIAEMIHTAHLIHRGVVNLSPLVYPDGTVLNDMVFGNKIAILSGDYLLANACTGLANLNNSQVVELVSSAISDFMEAEFMGAQDLRDAPLPSLAFTLADWEDKNALAAGSLLAKSCQGAMMLAGHDEARQKKAFAFGKCIALAWQVHTDLQPFLSPSGPPSTPFDLTSAPVVLQVAAAVEDQHKEEGCASARAVIDVVEASRDSSDNCDFAKLHECIVRGTGVSAAQALRRKYASGALSVLAELEASDARTALENIVHALTED